MMFRKIDKGRGNIMKKRRIAALLIATCVVAATGCGNKEISNKYIEISQYKGVEVENVTAEKVKDEDVTSYIDSVLAENRNEVTDRALEEGDLAEFEYTGKLGGEVFDQGVLTLGNGESYVDGFVEGIYGHKAGETFDLPITFPEGYGGAEKPELSGADVIFTITITSIKDKELPELTDKLVKKISEKSKTVEEYKKEVKEVIQTSNKKTAETDLGNNVWKAVLENVKVKEYPEERLNEIVEDLKVQMEQMMAYYGITYDAYLEQSGMTQEEADKQTKESAKEYLKQVLATELIAEKEGIKLSDKDYKKIMKEYAEEYGYESAEAMNAQIGEEQVKQVILQDKVKELLIKECKFVEVKKDKEK